MVNKWIAHIKKTMRKMKDSGTYVAGKGLKQVIAVAKKSWHSVKKGVGLKGGAEGDEKTEDVNLNAPSSSTTKKVDGTSGMELEGEKVTGGRKRKTRRRRRHSRRR